MKITKERVEQILPQNIKETTLLSDNAKNVLAMMMHSLLVAKGAQDSGVLVISNNRLRALLEMNRDCMLNAIRELEEYDLITRIVGKSRIEGETSTASEYHFNWDNIYNKPLKKKTSEELFSKFFKPSGTPSGTATTITTTTSIAIASTTSTTTPITTSTAIASSNAIASTTSTTSTTFTIKTFQKEVESLLECKYENELIKKKIDIIKNLNTKRLEIGESMYNRCLSYLNRKYNEKYEAVQADSDTTSSTEELDEEDDILPF